MRSRELFSGMAPSEISPRCVSAAAREGCNPSNPSLIEFHLEMECYGMDSGFSLINGPGSPFTSITCRVNRLVRASRLRLVGDELAYSGGAADQGGAADPDLFQTASEFTLALQAPRDRSGLTIREVTRLADGRAATVGDYFSGRHLPLDRELFARILAAFGRATRRGSSGGSWRSRGCGGCRGGAVRLRTGGLPGTRRPTRSGSSAGRMSLACYGRMPPRCQSCRRSRQAPPPTRRAGRR
jgi:hypothetical protein